MLMQLCLQQALIVEPHSPIQNPELTKDAINYDGNLEDVLERGRLSPDGKMIEVEAYLLSNWTYGNDWQRYLDTPLLAHADSAISLSRDYDAVVGIKEAGVPFAKIFEMIGLPIFNIDFSHYKRKMDQPEIDTSDLRQLQKSQSVLLTDIDFVSGRTLRTVTNYLRSNGVNVKGVYIGLSQWPGIESDCFHVGNDSVDFNLFWKQCGYVRQMRNMLPYRKGVIPKDLMVYTANRDFIYSKRGIASRVARYLKSFN